MKDLREIAAACRPVIGRAVGMYVDRLGRLPNAAEMDMIERAVASAFVRQLDPAAPTTTLQ